MYLHDVLLGVIAAAVAEGGGEDQGDGLHHVHIKNWMENNIPGESGPQDNG
jgi:hypothetical protein